MNQVEREKLKKAIEALFSDQEDSFTIGTDMLIRLYKSAEERANNASTRLVVGSGKKAKSAPKRKPVKSNRQRPATSG